MTAPTPNPSPVRPDRPESTYKCAICKGVFEKGWTDEEATQELGEQFPGFTPADCDVVCDDCYNKFMGTAP